MNILMIVDWFQSLGIPFQADTLDQHERTRNRESLLDLCTCWWPMLIDTAQRFAAGETYRVIDRRCWAKRAGKAAPRVGNRVDSIGKNAEDSGGPHPARKALYSKSCGDHFKAMASPSLGSYIRRRARELDTTNPSGIDLIEENPRSVENAQNGRLDENSMSHKVCPLQTIGTRSLRIPVSEQGVATDTSKEK
uniref:Uncharacterized protein n=1 Tax=Moniliophthora roreri TaxID=221103 RepID=A0A0W0GFJ9_MONRR